MENPRPDKVAVVAEVRERLANAEAAVLTEYRGLDVPALAELRAALRAVGGEYKVYKNTLVRLAVSDLAFDIDDLLTGPTAIALVGERPDGSAGDAVSLAKALDEFAKVHEALVIKGGLLDSERLSVEQIRALAKIAPREVLLAQIAGALAAPMQQFASLLNALPQNLAYGLKALIDQQGGPVSSDDADEGEAVADEAPVEETDSDAVAEEAPADEGEAVADEAPVEETDSDAVAEEAPADDNDAAAEEAPADDNGVTAEEADADTETAAADDTEEA